MGLGGWDGMEWGENSSKLSHLIDYNEFHYTEQLKVIGAYQYHTSRGGRTWFLGQKRGVHFLTTMTESIVNANLRPECGATSTWLSQQYYCLPLADAKCSIQVP